MMRAILSLIIALVSIAKAGAIQDFGIPIDDNADNVLLPIADAVEYDTSLPEQMIYLGQTPAGTLEPGTLTIVLKNLNPKAVKTRIIEVLDENKYLSHNKSEIAEVADASSTHTVTVQGLRENTQLAKYKIQLINEKNKIIGTKSLRLNLNIRTYVHEGNSYTSCSADIACAKFKFPNEKPFYHLYGSSCGIGGGSGTPDETCDEQFAE